jgi:hypothetical protein
MRKFSSTESGLGEDQEGLYFDLANVEVEKLRMPKAYRTIVEGSILIVNK